VTVSYPPGAKIETHHHGKSAFIMAYVISGAVRSKSKVSLHVSITPVRRGVKPRRAPHDQ
jgi:quercetin dioxygenase-like cupin family protein